MTFTSPPVDPFTLLPDKRAFAAAMRAWNIDWMQVFVEELDEFADDVAAIEPSATAAAIIAAKPVNYDAGTYYAPGLSVIYSGSAYLKLTTAVAGTTPVSGVDWFKLPEGSSKRNIYHPAGYYFFGHDAYSNIATGGLVASTCYAVPFDRAITIDALVVQVTGSIGGATLRLGIYKADATDGGPGTLVYDLGAIAAATSGLKTVTLPANLAVTEPLWLVMNSNANATFANHVDVTANGASPQVSATAIAAVGGFRIARADAALPATFPSSGTSARTNMSTVPHIQARTA